VPGAPQPGLEQESKSHEMVYFDTATNDASMRQLERIAPLPDREGYILGEQFLDDPRDTPLLVFVNTRSGSQQGPILKTQLRRLLNPIQIWDLADGGPEKVLKSFSVFTRLRILVCGGDGTVSWIISTLDKMKLERWPPIAILPLGTGNDLARIHGTYISEYTKIQIIPYLC
jgi:Sphingosine kinase and enzymes related to eukaryotic diacylglycerol kinase